MGTETQYYTRIAKSAGIAFNDLVDDAEDMYGHQEGYSGAINSCNGFSMTKLDQKTFTHAAIERWYEYHEEHCQKHDVVCLELPRSHLGKMSNGKSYPRGHKKYLFVAACPS